MISRVPKLRRHFIYRISGMTRAMWQTPHPRWGRPAAVVGIFIGAWDATRMWYGFEIRVGGREQGVIFMPEEDIVKLKVEELGPYVATDKR